MTVISQVISLETSKWCQFVIFCIFMYVIKNLIYFYSNKSILDFNDNYLAYIIPLKQYCAQIYNKRMVLEILPPSRKVCYSPIFLVLNYKLPAKIYKFLTN